MPWASETRPPVRGAPFVIPHDVLARLGNGDTGAGYGALCNALGIHPMVANRVKAYSIRTANAKDRSGPHVRFGS
jgi:hypothetical protein